MCVVCGIIPTFSEQHLECCLSCTLHLQFVTFSFTVWALSVAGMVKLTKGSHDISGVTLQVTEGQMPSQSQLQQVVSFPSTHSPASQLMLPPPHVLPSTAQGLTLATATNGQSFTQTGDSTAEIDRPDNIPVDVGSLAQAKSTIVTSLSTSIRTSSIMSESLTSISPVVRVVGILPDWDEYILNIVFDDEDEGGGEIEENGILIKGDEALITFKDSDGKCDFPINCELHQTASLVPSPLLTSILPEVGWVSDSLILLSV